MPQFEMHMTAGALTGPAKAELMDGLTRLLLKMEGAPDTPSALNITWGTVREYAAGDWSVGGRAAPGPRYRLVFTVPEGATGIHGPAMLGRREALVRKATALILQAEGAEVDTVNAGRVWVQILEIPNGFWGGYGVMTDVMDIATYVDAPIVMGRPTDKGLRMRRSFEESAAAGPPAGAR